MKRSLDRYAGTSPEAVASGSSAQMMYFVEDAKADIAVLAAENQSLRKIISDCAAALPNGAFISPEASVEFMANLPREIALLHERIGAYPA